MESVLLLLIKAKDEASKELEKTAGSLGKISGKMNEVIKSTLKYASIAGGVFVAGVGMAVKEAAAFQQRMADISTVISGDSTKAIGELREGILKMTAVIPKSADELGAEAYNILSAGISDTGQALKVLESASKLAVAGLGSEAGAVDIMTSAINAFGLKADDAAKISDVLFKTTKYGKTTVEQMAQAFGATAPVVASAGIKLEEFSAAVAAMTTTGLPAAQAQNQIRAAITQLLKPTDDMQKLLKKAGLESGAAALKNLGLVDTMEALDKAAGGSSETLSKAWSSVEAFGAATSLTGQTSGVFVQALKDMQTGVNAVDDAFQKQQATVQNQVKLIKNDLNVALIKLGDKLLPKVSEGIAAVRKWLKDNEKVIDSVIDTIAKGIEKAFKAIGKIIDYLVEHKETVKEFAVVLGILAAAFIAVSIALWAVNAAATVFAIVTAPITGPIILIIAAIAAWIAIGVMLWRNWEKIGTKAKILMFTLGLLIAPILALIVAGIAIVKNWDKIKAAAVATWDAIKNAVVAAWEGIKAGISAAWNWIMTYVLTPIGVVLYAVFIWPWLFAYAAIMQVWKQIQDGVFAAWNWVVVNILTPIAQAIDFLLVQPFIYAKDKLVQAWAWIRDTASAGWNWVKTSVLIPIGNAVQSYVVEPFNRARKGVSDAWDGVKNKISSVWEGIKTIVRDSVNWMVDKLNGFIGGVNKIKIPGWVPNIGGKGFNIPTIPRLATGASLVTSDGLAQIHKGEAVIPARYNPYNPQNIDNNDNRDFSKKVEIQNLTINNGMDLKSLMQTLELSLS